MSETCVTILQVLSVCVPCGVDRRAIINDDSLVRG